MSSLAFSRSGNYLVSGGHDGSLRCWDIRKYQCIYEIQAHRKKYNEGVLNVISHSDGNLLASGGADSVIKIFSVNE